MTYTRANKKWTVNELLTLQREYELLELDISEIAQLHNRSPNAIMYKLESEGFVDDYRNARGYNIMSQVNYLSVDTDLPSNNDNDNRITNLEISISGIEKTLKVITNAIFNKQKLSFF
jgi:hypothetical protein